MNLFDDIYNSVDSSEDNTIINKIVNEIKKYDVYDVISRISALNLLPQNQNKSILFDTLISSILFETKESYKCDNIMTHNKFRSIIEKLNSTLVTGMIDPNDNIFVQNIMYDDNYMVFNGIDTTPAYNLQMLIDILFYYKNDFPSIFLESAKKLIDMTLKISNSIANKTDADINKKNTDDGRNIILPNSNTINEYAKYITFNEVDFSEYLNNDYELLNDIIISFGNKNIGDIDNRPFYFRPFLRNENNHTLILLNISILPQFTLFKIINIAEKLGIKDKVINRYNDYIWMNCQNYLYTLGHYKIKETQFNIQLEDKLYYKEMIASLYNDKLMLVFFICDDAYKYNENNMFTYYPNDKLIKIFKDRTEYYCSKFQKTNILKNDIVSLVLVHSIGRTMLVGTNKNPSKYQFLSLKPFELQCISINERDNKNFLFRYIRAKNQIISGKYFFSELNLINYYKENKSTFYVSDDFDTTQNTYLAIVGTSCDYIHKAIECEDAIIVPSYTDNNISRIVAFDKFRLIYKEYNIFPIKKIAICILFNNCIIWLTSNEIISEMDKNIYINIIDLISFWLNESRTIIEKIQLKNNLYHFNIMISGNKKSYYVKAEQNADIKLEDNLIIESVDNHYNLIWTPVAYQQLNCIANTREKELCQIILNILNNNSYDNYQNELNNIFSNLLKKKLICLDYIENPSLKPMHYENNRNIHLDDEDILLSLIGKQIIESGEWKYGIIDNKQRTKVANKVVEILYQMLQQKIKELNPTNLIEIIYLDLEEAIYKTLSFQKNYMYNIVCYPENEKKFILDYQNLNKISLALKFMIEYVAAKPPKGDKILSIGEYEYILAICSLIINWAYKNDLFYYNIFNTPIEILKSNRIGIKNSEFLNMSKNIYLSLIQEIKYHSSPILTENDNLKDNNYKKYSNDLDDAFLSNYGYSFNNFYTVINRILIYGIEKCEKEIFVKNRDVLIKYISNMEKNIPIKIINKIIDDISLTERNDFLIPPSNYRKEDIYPWRFNRQYSFNRRPIIVRGNKLIWGNRQLYNMLVYTIHLIYDGKIPTKNKKMANLIGKMSNDRGNKFNQHIVKILSDMNVFQIEANIKKINRHPISDKNGNTLGDIDVLIIDRERHHIYVSEVKDFNFSKNPYEMHLEYQKMFVDGKEKCFYTKHKRRIDWIKEHIEDVKIQYKLDNKKWKISGIFIVSEPLISNNVYHKNIEIITLSELSIERIRSIK